MSDLDKQSAWLITAAHALRSAAGPEDELAALDALAVIAREIGLHDDAQALAMQAARIRLVETSRREMREYFDGQMKLPLTGGSAQ